METEKAADLVRKLSRATLHIMQVRNDVVGHVIDNPEVDRLLAKAVARIEDAIIEIGNEVGFSQEDLQELAAHVTVAPI